MTVGYGEGGFGQGGYGHPWVRHVDRHVHATVLNAVRASITGLGWTAAETLPFGEVNSDVVTFVDTPAFAGDVLSPAVKSGMVACTLGDEFSPLMQEMGGPLAQQDYPIFFDVFQKTHASALSLASDIRDTLLGRLPGTHRFLPVINQLTGDELLGWRIELEDVERVGPHSALPLHWQVVKVTASTYYPEVSY